MRANAAAALRPHLASALLGAVASAACIASEPDAGVPAATVRDSAGVTLVENPAVPADARTGWTLGAEPLVEIGALEGAEAEQLYRVRDATRLADGRIAIVNSGSQEVRVFDATGAHLRSWGGDGEGPGEFRDPTSIAPWPGDSLAVWDRRLRRLDVRPTSGEPGRTVTYPSLGEVATPVFSHLLDDGTMVVSAIRILDGELENGLSRLPIVAAVVDGDGELVHSLGEHAGGEVYIRVRGESVDILAVPVARNIVMGGAGAESLIAQTDRFELKFWDAEGRLTRVVRVAEPARPLPAGERARLIDSQVDQAPEPMRPRIRTMLEEIAMPDTLPAYTDVVRDATGHHWVRVFRLPYETGSAGWIVLDEAGQVVGRIELPPALDVYEIGADYILARATDELGVERVQLWALDRG